MTMAEYIDKEQLLSDLYSKQDDENLDMMFEIANFPAADVAPVVHGMWISVENPRWRAYSHDKCSICGWWNTKNALCYDGIRKPGHSLNYCPNCGEKMDGDR